MGKPFIPMEGAEVLSSYHRIIVSSSSLAPLQSEQGRRSTAHLRYPLLYLPDFLWRNPLQTTK